MKDIKLIGIDPGKSAGTMAIYVDGELLLEKLEADTPNELYTQTAEHSGLGDYRVVCLVEDAVVNMGFGGGPNIFMSATKLANHCGQLDCCLSLCAIPFTKVRPSVWMNAMFPDRPKGKGDKNKELRKWYIRDQAQLRFPDVKIPKYAGDAVGVLMYLMKERGVL